MLRNTFTNIKRVCVSSLLPRVWRGHIVKCSHGKFQKLSCALFSTGTKSTDKDREKCNQILRYVFGNEEPIKGGDKNKTRTLKLEPVFFKDAPDDPFAVKIDVKALKERLDTKDAGEGEPFDKKIDPKEIKYHEDPQKSQANLCSAKDELFEKKLDAILQATSNVIKEEKQALFQEQATTTRYDESETLEQKVEQINEPNLVESGKNENERQTNPQVLMNKRTLRDTNDTIMLMKNLISRPSGKGQEKERKEDFATHVARSDLTEQQKFDQKLMKAIKNAAVKSTDMSLTNTVPNHPDVISDLKKIDSVLNQQKTVNIKQNASSNTNEVSQSAAVPNQLTIEMEQDPATAAVAPKFVPKLLDEDKISENEPEFSNAVVNSSKEETKAYAETTHEHETTLQPENNEHAETIWEDVQAPFEAEKSLKLSAMQVTPVQIAPAIDVPEKDARPPVLQVHSLEHRAPLMDPRGEVPYQWPTSNQYPYPPSPYQGYPHQGAPPPYHYPTPGQYQTQQVQQGYPQGQSALRMSASSNVEYGQPTMKMSNTSNVEQKFAEHSSASDYKVQGKNISKVGSSINDGNWAASQMFVTSPQAAREEKTIASGPQKQKKADPNVKTSLSEPLKESQKQESQSSQEQQSKTSSQVYFGAQPIVYHYNMRQVSPDTRFSVPLQGNTYSGYNMYQQQNDNPYQQDWKNIYQQPSYLQQSYQQPMSQQSGYQQPMSQQSGYQQPMSQQSGYQQPMSQQSGYQQPMSQQSGYQQPMSQQPGYQQSSYQQPSYQQQSYQQPSSQQPSSQQRSSQQLSNQQLSFQQPSQSPYWASTQQMQTNWASNPVQQMQANVASNPVQQMQANVALNPEQNSVSEDEGIPAPFGDGPPTQEQIQSIHAQWNRWQQRQFSGASQPQYTQQNVLLDYPQIEYQKEQPQQAPIDYRMLYQQQQMMRQQQMQQNWGHDAFHQQQLQNTAQMINQQAWPSDEHKWHPKWNIYPEALLDAYHQRMHDAKAWNAIGLQTKSPLDQAPEWEIDPFDTKVSEKKEKDTKKSSKENKDQVNLIKVETETSSSSAEKTIQAGNVEHFSGDKIEEIPSTDEKTEAKKKSSHKSLLTWFFGEPEPKEKPSSAVIESTSEPQIKGLSQEKDKPKSSKKRPPDSEWPPKMGGSMEGNKFDAVVSAGNVDFPQAKRDPPAMPEKKDEEKKGKDKPNDSNLMVSSKVLGTALLPDIPMEKTKTTKDKVEKQSLNKSELDAVNNNLLEKGKHEDGNLPTPSKETLLIKRQTKLTQQRVTAGHFKFQNKTCIPYPYIFPYVDENTASSVVEPLKNLSMSSGNTGMDNKSTADNDKIEESYSPPLLSKIRTHIPAAVGPLPCADNLKDLTVFHLLKTARLKNRIDSYQGFLDANEKSLTPELDKTTSVKKQ